MFIKQELSATAVKKIKSLKGKDLSLIEKVKYSSPTLVAKVVDPQLVSNDQKKIEQILYDSSCYYYKFHEQRREEVRLMATKCKGGAKKAPKGGKKPTKGGKC